MTDLKRHRTRSKPSAVRRIFRVAVMLKGADGALELIGGLLFLLVKPATIDRTVALLTRHELAQDPHDLVANMLVHAAHHLSVNTKLLAGLYLLGHGVIKIVLVIGLLGERRGIYPYAFFFLIVFISLELGRLVESFSLGISMLMVFDLFVITMVWLEYKRIQ